jgi:hypothetical protein
MPVTAIAAGIGLVGGIGKMIGRGKANRQMRDLLASQPKYKYDEMARTLLNARMPGAAQAERNIYQGGANTMGRMQQAATSSADLMQAAAGTQAQENQAFQGLAGQEAQDYQRRYGNYQEEQQRKFADELRQYQTRSQLEGAIQENKQNTWGDIANMGFGLASFNAQGGFGDKGLKGLFGKTGTTSPAQAYAAPSQNMMYGTGGGITQPPMIGGTTPSYFSNLIGRTPIPQQQEESQFDYNNPWTYGGYRTR